jgi:hypothetical protein
MYAIPTPVHGNTAARWLLSTAVLAWLIGVVWASLGGALGALAQAFMPAFAALVALGIAAPLVAYFTLQTVRRAINSVGLRWLTLMHIWRIPAALVFFWYGVLGEAQRPFRLRAALREWRRPLPGGRRAVP